MTIGILRRCDFDDVEAARVQTILQARGVDVVDVDLSHYPGDATIAHGVGIAAPIASIAGVDLTTLRSVWVRPLGRASSAGPEPVDDPLAGFSADDREIARGQATAALSGWLECSDAFVVDVPVNVTRVRTLRLAQRFGFDVPPTLITSNPEALRRFAAQVDGEVVVRFVDPDRVSSDTDPHGPSRTRLLDPDELEDLDGLVAAPMQFQARIPKALELRVTVVGSRTFTGAVDSSGSEHGALDWRTDPELVTAFVAHDLPPELECTLLRLCDALHLNFATADVILTPEGRHVLLEVNGPSYYGFLEDATGLPISEAVADLLDGTARPRWRPSC
ncbi:MAG TPA: hypothetical protein VGO03_04030 [Acidimicrobiia bacterium]|jgi:hypothetical protein